MNTWYVIPLALLVVFSGIPTNVKAQVEVHNSITTQQVTLNNDFTPVSIATANLMVPKPVVPKAPTTREMVKEYAKTAIAKMFPGQSFEKFAYIVERESMWDPTATNKSSGACGIAQMLPCVGKPGIVAPGVSYKSLPYEEQIRLMGVYIKGRYQTLDRAYIHKVARGWY